MPYLFTTKNNVVIYTILLTFIVLYVIICVRNSLKGTYIMKLTKEELILGIAHCEEIETATTNEQHPCYDMVNVQTTKEFHLPEPFNGNIETAEILFIGSNPNYDENENYPTKLWNDEDIISFFGNRFRLMPKNKYSRYWKAVIEWAGLILNEENKDSILNKIALTEIVHCKSHSDKEISRICKTHCVEKWLKKVLSVFNGKYIVIVGGKAKAYNFLTFHVIITIKI